MKARILIISHVFPYPLHDGGKFDVYFRLQALHRLGYATTLIAFYNPALGLPEALPLKQLCEEVIPLPYLRRHISKILHYKPYAIASKENMPALQEITLSLVEKKHEFSFLIAESHHVLTAAWQVQQALDIPKLYLRSHNNEPRFMLSLSRTSAPFSLAQTFFAAEAAKYWLYEKALMKRFSTKDAIWHISHDEWKESSKRYPHISQTFLPAGIDVDKLSSFVPSTKKHALFVGALFSPNNLQGLRWYLKHVHPQVQKQVPAYRLFIAGNTVGANRKKIEALLHRENAIAFYDTPHDLLPIYQEAQVFINPMRFGAGVKLKTLDAILQGLPVVTTTTGNEGTGLVPDQHLLVKDNPKEFATHVIALLDNEEQRKRLVHASQSHLKKTYDQTKALHTLLTMPS